jgi:hypothetical protein
MKSSLESEIENCVEEIDFILYNNELENGMYIEKMVAHHLNAHGRTGWIYNDEISGPQINEISEKALMHIADRGIIYHQKFKITSELKNDIRYFKTELIDESEKVLTYNELDDEMHSKKKIFLSDRDLLSYVN